MVRHTLIFPAKQLRARVIAGYMRQAGYTQAVVFTCGNAATALRKHCVDVLEIGPQGTLAPRRWWTPADIRKTWPTLFDATSGHLPTPLMVYIAYEFKQQLGVLRSHITYVVPSGSGETVICLKIAYPNIKFVAQYDASKESTLYNPEVPLNKLVAALVPMEFI